MSSILESPADAVLVDRNAAAEPPLSPEQAGLWYLQRLAPDCGAFHLLFSIDVECVDADLPVRATEALAAMTAAHDVLRTVLPTTPHGPVQRILSEATPDLRVVDSTDSTDDVLRERARLDSRQPFDLDRGPLWRVQLYRRAASRWLVVVVAHHVMLDFWSMGLLLQEMAGRLGVGVGVGGGTGIDDALASRPDGCAYAAHAERCQASLADPARSAAGLAYWAAQLHGAPPVHGLPLDAPRTATPSYDGASLPFSLDLPTSDAVRQVARSHDVTPFMVMLAAYAVLLQQYSGDVDLVVASPVAGRTGRAQRTQLGQFVSTVALRLRPDARAGFGDLLRQVRETVVDALRHADVPFDRLVRVLEPQRDPAYAPIAQMAFAWERLPLLADFERYFLAEPPPDVRDIPGGRLRPFAVPQQEGQFELNLEMGGELDGAFVGVFKYRTRLFRRETIDAMAECFAHLVRRLAELPEVPLLEQTLDAAPPAMRALSRGRGDVRTWPEGSVLAQIAAHARATPHAAASSDAARSLDYADLWARARSIGGALQAIGVGPGARVGLMLGRSVDLVAGILGIWLAGGAYVPLDPDFPPARLVDVADDANLTALLTERSVEALWPVDLPVVCVDQALPSPPALLHASRFADPAADTAYILYTSGSTGRPKGVRVAHASVRNFLLSMRDLMGCDATTCLLAVTTPAFDISVLELLLPLLVGGEVRIADAASTRDGKLLAWWIDGPSQRPVTAMQATPATWHMLIDAGWAGRPDLALLCGGEPLPPSLAERLLARAGAAWNLYGPTETTVWSSAARLRSGDAVHLGQPLANTRYCVLDAQGHAVPPGVLGELWIGGDGLAIDYWRQPALTAERFRVLPTMPDAGRLYRTGDRVRWNADGRLEHHGRLDFQVKLRGFRIELGEIESVLRRQPGIDDAVVVLRAHASSDPRLVAYVVARGEAPQVDALRSALRSVLPGYMLPSAYIFIDEMPLTANRKIDRRALPDPVPRPATGITDDDVPRGPFEIRLAGLFAELLGIDRVGLHDSFFDLGGHSLLAVRLVAAVRREFGVELAVAELIQHDSVAALALRLRQVDAEPPEALVTLRAGGDAQPLWLFHPIGGNVFCYVELVRHLSPSRPVVAVQSPGLARAGEAEVGIEAMARRYLLLLRERQPEGPYLLGGWCFGGNVAFEAARQLRDAGQQVSGVVLIDTRAPIAENMPDDADDATLLSWFARDLAAPYGKVLAIEPGHLRSLPEASMFDHVLERAQAIGVLPPDADADVLSRYFEVYLANGMALRDYAPPPERLPLLLLRAVDEPLAHGPSLGWDRIARGALETHGVPGDHVSVMHAPNAAAVAARIDACFAVVPRSTRVS